MSVPKLENDRDRAEWLAARADAANLIAAGWRMVPMNAPAPDMARNLGLLADALYLEFRARCER